MTAADATQSVSPGRTAGDAASGRPARHKRSSLLRHVRLMAPRKPAAGAQQEQQLPGRASLHLKGAAGANRAWDLVPHHRLVIGLLEPVTT